MLTTVETSKERVLLRNLQVLDVKKGQLSGQTNVLVEGRIILDLDAPAADAVCDTIDCEGLTLMPGLIDCHCHILSPYLSSQDSPLPPAWSLKQMRLNFEGTLAGGVVCVRDMLSPIKIMNSNRRKIASGKFIGPDIAASGALLSVKGGYPEFINPMPFPLSLASEPKMHADTPEHGAQFVRYLKKKGADHIKVGYTSFYRDFAIKKRMPTVSDDTLHAICKAAHELGLIVSVHHNWSQDLDHLLQFDIDSLEHVVYDRELTDEQIALAKKKGVTFVPTLTVSDSMARFEEKLGFLESDRAKEMFVEPARKHLHWISSTWLDFKNERYDEAFGFWRANRKNYAGVERSVKRMHEAGIPLCAGTDLGAVVAWPGEMADEVIRLHHVGLTKIEAIRAATLNAAKLLQREKTLGSVEPGMYADVSLVAGNPLEDLYSLRRVRLVGKGGRWHRPKHPELPDFWPGFSITFKN
ncbi:MAG: amidohydrolase family protein [bacterium]